MPAPITRTLTSAPAGPVRFTFQMGHIPTVVKVADVPAIEVTLTTYADPGTAAADAVERAALAQEGSAVTLTVPDAPGGGSATTVTSVSRGGRSVVQSVSNSGSGAVVVVGGDFYGDVNLQGGRVTMRGSVLGPTMVINGSPGIQAEILIPADSTLHMTSKTADLTVEGEVNAIDYTSTSGNLRVGACQSLTYGTTGGDIYADVADRVALRTTFGDIRLGRTEDVRASSVSGNVRIDDFGGMARITTVSGDVSIHATEGGTITADSTSGDISVTAIPGLADEVGENRLIVNARTISGDVTVPQPTAAGAYRPRPSRRRP
ncbi:DUF4097 family beta strand repeat-containing protein [Nonomuraea bangladeshensis]|uniref:DUF4097 family beta strand repeat-containing protein n=1 Tax=Nonomuraea bangladeshensis TaxID=404385 RepID=UPI003C2F759C